MTTTTTSTHRSAVERTVDWLVDRDGDLYGDERERLHWYEAVSAAAAVQWVAVPWVAAVVLLVQGSAVTVLVVLVFFAMYLPMVLASAYVARRKVRTNPPRWSGKRVLFTFLGIAPYVLLAAGFVRAVTDEPATWVGSLVGALVGVAGVLAVVTVRGRREAAREDAEADHEDQRR